VKENPFQEVDKKTAIF